MRAHFFLSSTLMSYREPHICFACAIPVCTTLVWGLLLQFSPSLHWTKHSHSLQSFLTDHVLQTFSLLLWIIISLKHSSQNLNTPFLFRHQPHKIIYGTQYSYVMFSSIFTTAISFTEARLWLCMTPTSSYGDMLPCWEFWVLYLCSWFFEL